MTNSDIAHWVIYLVGLLKAKYGKDWKEHISCE